MPLAREHHMLGAGLAYVFADPFGRTDSGVSSYISNSVEQLEKNGFNAVCISRKNKEKLTAYRTRLAEEVKVIKSGSQRVIVEAPESDAVTTQIPDSDAELHIRLHCSRQLGSYIQNRAICNASIRLEQGELHRASIISAPSRSAIIATKLLFSLPNEISTYPNPAPEFSLPAASSGSKGYVLFVGRMQNLKGIHFLEDIVRRMPDVSFAIACPTSDYRTFSSAFKNMMFVDGSRMDRATLYAHASVVVVLSLYETASMVGIEALSAGVPVVTWEHLGIAEYSTRPMLRTVRAFSISAMVSAINDAINSASVDEAKGEVFLNSVNSLFYKGLNSSIDHHSCDLMPITLTKSKSKSVTNTLEIIKGNQNTPIVISTPRWRRKLRKFQRDPRQFFKDARIFNSFLVTTEKANAPTGGNVKTKKVPHVDLSVAASPQPTLTFPKLSGKMPSIFCEIRETGKITFQDPPQKPEGLISCFLYPGTMSDTAFDLLDNFNRYDDFKYLHQPFLQHGVFHDLSHCTACDLINRVDVANKNKISSIDNIFLLNPAPALVECLRSCGTRQRVIPILTQTDAQAPPPWHTDVLIVVGEHPITSDSKNYWRRIIHVNSIADLPAACKRAIQEGVPKSPDFFLPVLGFKAPQRADLLSTDVCYHQGLLVMPEDHVNPGGTMQEICKHMATQVTEIAVCESVYLRYRSLFDSIDNLDARTHALSYCLHDGVIFDVRT